MLQAGRHDHRLAERAEDIGAVEEVAFVDRTAGAQVVERDFGEKKRLAGIHVGFGAELFESAADHVLLYHVGGR